MLITITVLFIHNRFFLSELCWEKCGDIALVLRFVCTFRLSVGQLTCSFLQFEINRDITIRICLIQVLIYTDRRSMSLRTYVFMNNIRQGSHTLAKYRRDWLENTLIANIMLVYMSYRSNILNHYAL